MNQTIDREPIDRETISFFSTVQNIAQFREDADWCENRCRYLEWEANQRRRTLRNILGYALAATVITLVYMLRIGGG